MEGKESLVSKEYERGTCYITEKLNVGRSAIYRKNRYFNVLRKTQTEAEELMEISTMP